MMSEHGKTVRAPKVEGTGEGYAEEEAFGLREIRAENERLKLVAVEMRILGEL